MWRVQSPCNSCLGIVPPSWSAKSVQVFTNIWGIVGPGVSTLLHLEGKGRSCRLGPGRCAMVWEW